MSIIIQKITDKYNLFLTDCRDFVTKLEKNRFSQSEPGFVRLSLWTRYRTERGYHKKEQGRRIRPCSKNRLMYAKHNQTKYELIRCRLIVFCIDTVISLIL